MDMETCSYDSVVNTLIETGERSELASRLGIHGQEFRTRHAGRGPTERTAHQRPAGYATACMPKEDGRTSRDLSVGLSLHKTTGINQVPTRALTAPRKCAAEIAAIHPSEVGGDRTQAGSAGRQRSGCAGVACEGWPELFRLCKSLW